MPQPIPASATAAVAGLLAQSGATLAAADMTSQNRTIRIGVADIPPGSRAMGRLNSHGMFVIIVPRDVTAEEAATFALHELQHRFRGDPPAPTKDSSANEIGVYMCIEAETNCNVLGMMMMAG